MQDLDRAYVINGSDLRIELGGSNGRPPLVPNPRDVAEYLIDRIARPLGAELPEVRPGGVCVQPGDVVDAHVCCEHVAADPELAAMAAVLAALERLRPDECSRVLDWARRRLPLEPPF